MNLQDLAQNIADHEISQGIVDACIDGRVEVDEYEFTEADLEWIYEAASDGVIEGDVDLRELRDEVRDILTRELEERMPDEQLNRMAYCSDRTCGATDCSRCYPW